jgi:hypothetical protein
MAAIVRERERALYKGHADFFFFWKSGGIFGVGGNTKEIFQEDWRVRDGFRDGFPGFHKSKKSFPVNNKRVERRRN